MEIDVKDGKVALNISGTFAPEELRALLRKLCEAHADAIPNGRGNQGHPVFCWGATNVITGNAPGAVKVLFETPAFGWVGVDLPVRGAVELAHKVTGACCIELSALEAKASEELRGAVPGHVGGAQH